MKLLLFECQHVYYLPQFLPVMEELSRRSGYELYASMPNTADAWEFAVFQKALPLNEVTILTAKNERRRLELLRSRQFDALFIGNVGRLHRIAGPDTLVVMIYHGIGLKKSYYRDFDPRIDLWAVESRERYRELRESGFKAAVLTGFTKLDPLRRPSRYDRQVTLPALGLREDRPTILYAPTFYPSSLKLLLPYILPVTRDYNVIVKLHSFSWYHRRYRYQHRQVENGIRDVPNIYLVPPDEINILPYYRLGDVLISDFSSTLFEFLALDRPIIQTEFYTLRRKHVLFPWLINRRLDLDRKHGIDFVYPLSSPEKLAAVLEETLQRDELSPQRQQAARRFLYPPDGQASRRLVDALETRLRLAGAGDHPG